RALNRHTGRPIDVAALERTITELGGIGRYESLTWQMVERDGEHGLRVHAEPKAYAPPFMFLGVSLENTTSSEFPFGLSGRSLAFDVLGSGAELRIDAAVGSDPSAGIAWYRPLGSTPLFFEPFAGVSTQTLNAIVNHEIVASYHETTSILGAGAGVNLGSLDEIRGAIQWGRIDANVRIGDPGLPDLNGAQTLFRIP